MMSLTAANTYTGPTSVLAGRLAIDGNITSSVTVGSSGNLGGSGAITGDVVNNGIVSPGNSIGTLTINGSYTGTASSSLQIEANAAGQSDLLKVVGGTATLGGGTVAAMPAPNQIYAMSNTYTILTATGGRTGTFANATSSLPFLQASLSYDFNNAYLTLTPGGFARGAQTPNAAAVGRVFDLSVATATGDFANVIGATSSLTAAQGTAVMNAISGQNYSGFANAAIQTSLLFMNNFSSQVGGSSQGATPGSNRVALAEACDYPTEEAPLLPTWGV
jgi:autotransporter-associated beta strand protein